ncbi:OmpA family protein [Myxococcota bacterium]|nr:OmpA family protein [Myxococcota bacterium]MBU1381103.1 OmpA family protein [Myxococcota bacterium]MBU1498228.1 OmpA family protein [Myxococcota bacterium]
MKIFFSKSAIVLSLIAVLAAVSTVEAARPRGIPSQIFTPSTDPQGILGVESSTVLNPWTLYFGLGVNWALAPMRLDFSGAGDNQKDALDYQTTFDFLFTLGLPWNMSAFLKVPLHRVGPGDAFNRDNLWGFTANEPLNTITRNVPRSIPGDTILGLKWRFFEKSGFSGAFMAGFVLPFGVEEVFGGEEHVAASGLFSFGYTSKRINFFFNAAYLYRPEHRILDPIDPTRILIASAPEIQISAGIRVGITRKLALAAAVQKFRYLSCDEGCDEPFEMRAGLEYKIKDNLGISLFAGSGQPLIEEYGRGTDFRFGVTLGWVADAFTKKVEVGDRDGDGIKDDVDMCPDDKEDIDGFEDQDGCPDPDNDQDGIPDKLDKCPNEPEDEDGFEDKDGCPDPDNDGDGVLDSADRCPGTDKDKVDNFKNTKEDRDGFEDEDGCPDLDNDGDGIPDSVDRCPNEKETVNGIDDTDGCPDQARGPKIVGGQLDLKGKITFEKGKDTITRQSLGTLLSAANILKANSTIRLVRIEVHVATMGSKRRDLLLSNARANAVRNYLLTKGVSGSQIQAAGYGSRYPLAAGRSKKADEKNERVEFIVVYQ